MVLLFLAGMPLTGCASNAATFYEGTRFAFVIEFKPESSQPMNLSLGYKRRIAAVVPPQKPAPKTPAQNQDPTHEGDALSLVSTFDVEGAGIGGVTIKNTFASGLAANEMTSGSDAGTKLKALFAPATFTKVSEDVQKRKVALEKKLGALNDNSKAGQILSLLGIKAKPPVGCENRESICILQDEISHAQDESTVQRIESAFTRALLAPTQ